jgi:hypothetical protein
MRRLFPLRPRRLFGGPGGPGGAGPQVLQQAFQMLESGGYAEAAAAFWQLAEVLHEHGMPLRAGKLALQAASAYLQAGDPNAALQCGRQGLALLVRGGRPGQAVRLASRMIYALRERGHAAQADALQAEVNQRLAGMVSEPVPFAAPAAGHGNLPAHCSACGGPLRPDEVDWLDAATAECPYCGNPVKTSPR